MAAAAGGPELERPGGPAGRGKPSPGAPGQSPRPEVPDGPGEPGPEEPPEPCEPEKLGLEETESSEPSDPGPAVAAPAARRAEEEKATSGRGGAAGEAPLAARADEAPGPPAPAAPGGAEWSSGEAAGGAPEEREAAGKGKGERAALPEQHGGPAGERERPRQREKRRQAGPDGPRLRGPARRRGGEERQPRAQAERAALQARQQAAAGGGPGRRLGGGEVAVKAADRIQAGARDEEAAGEAHVENSKLKHEIQNIETILKAQGEVLEGQSFMDFEYTKKENQKHSAKTDTLSDETVKLKKKVLNSVHILSQFREKLQFVEAQNQRRKAELTDIETLLSQKRDTLLRTKQARDRLQKNNLKLQQKCGLLGNEILLRDFEETADTVELLSQRLETLKRHHAGLILACRGIQKKIKEANSPFLAEDDQRKASMQKERRFL
ncbi:cilia- and flagella-associated protein 184 [Leptosomus discolor]